jgi:hypothetical protein
MTYEIYATITDEYGSRTIPTGICGWSRAAMAVEMAGLYRRSRTNETFHIEEVLYGDEFNAY